MESSVHPSVDFFLGATTPAGFKGYFAPLRREPGMQLVLLKSGPGCGKSTLMKRLARAAQEKGEPIQRIHCASDPDSLDGVSRGRQEQVGRPYGLAGRLRPPERLRKLRHFLCGRSGCG